MACPYLNSKRVTAAVTSRHEIISQLQTVGRVEEERCRSTIASPLVEPDVRISRIRLSRRLSPRGSTAALRPP